MGKLQITVFCDKNTISARWRLWHNIHAACSSLHLYRHLHTLSQPLWLDCEPLRREQAYSYLYLDDARFLEFLLIRWEGERRDWVDAWTKATQLLRLLPKSNASHSESLLVCSLALILIPCIQNCVCYHQHYSTFSNNCKEKYAFENVSYHLFCSFKISIYKVWSLCFFSEA